MIALPDTEPVLISNQDHFFDFIRAIQNEPVLAVDTESNSLFAYHEKVCLIQIATPAQDFIIDPLTVLDISLLSAIFANPKQQKIFHAAEYDLICLKRDYGFKFANLFDTMIAARILGEPQVGLGSLLDFYFGIKVDKRFQRANWGVRPLSRIMLDYARMDTHYLFALKSIFEEKLKQRGLWELAKEDFDILCRVEPPAIESNGKSCWKICGAARINGRQAAILQSLCTYRDLQARKMDLPHFKVLSNAFLVDLCQNPPHSIEELRTKRGATERLINRHGANLLKAIQQGEDSPPLSRQPSTRPNEKYLKRLEKLKEWRKLKAQDLKIESDVVIPKDIMEKIAALNPKNKGDLRKIMQSTPWRFRHYGESILSELSSLEE